MVALLAKMINNVTLFVSVFLDDIIALLDTYDRAT